jgi:ATP-dependent DNA helicase RecG
MQAEDLRNFFQDLSQWDCIPGSYGYDEIDQKTVKDFVNIAVKSRRMPPSSIDESVPEILNHLSLIQSEKITNGAIILFGKNPQRYFINAIVRVGRFKRADIIIGDKFIDGNLFRQIEEAEEAIRNYIDVRYEFPGDSFRRTEIWDYPLNSIREVLLNAVVHRDYFKSNRQTQIKIFDDHIWFYNPGGLPKGISIEDLHSPHSSVPRNPLIANVMYRANFIEVWGSGIERISKEFQEAGLPEPEFKEEMDGFSVYFRKNAETVETTEAGETETTEKIRPATGTELLIEDIIKNNNLNERQIRAVEYVIENGEISNKIYRELNSISDVTAKRELKDLDSMKILKKSGKGRTTVYRLIF